MGQGILAQINDLDKLIHAHLTLFFPNSCELNLEEIFTKP
jgi:hypothetical protein